MNFSGLGGIAIALIAGVWLFVLVPRWSDEVKAEAQPQTPPNKKADGAELGDRGRRLLNTKRMAAATAWASISATILLMAFATTNSVLLLGLVFSIPVGALAAWLALLSTRTLAGLQPTVAIVRPRRKVDLNIQVPTSEPPAAGVFDQRTWVPSALPEPLNNRLGELRQQAPVVSFEQLKIDSETTKATESAEPTAQNEINVIEILKRRRVI